MKLVPQFLGSIMRQCVVLVFIDEQREFRDGHEHGNEFGTDSDVLVDFKDFAFLGQIRAFAAN